MLKEYSEEKGKLSSYVPWICLIDKGVVLNKNGTLQKTLKYRGYDLDSSTVYELKNINAKLNDVIKRLGQGWSLNVEARRKRCTDYIEAENEILAIDIIEKERKLNFLENEHFESEYYLTIVQLIPTDNSKKVGEIFLEYAKKSEILDKTLENFNKEFKKILNLFKEIFLEVTELDDLKDYLYDGNAMRTLAGKKLHKKKNRLNGFLKTYEGRYEYRRICCSDRQEVWQFMEKWRQQKVESYENEISLDYEVAGIHDILKNCSAFNVPMAGVYIDGELKAFTVGSLNERENMAVIHIEKADPEINGLYQFINQQFLVHEFPDVALVNREDDVGMPGLRKAKMSYYPVDFARKYSVKKKY